jgi:hypothetical protein
MDRRTRNLFALVLVTVLALTGGAALILGASPDDAMVPAGTEEATGVVVAVESSGLTDVRAFTLRAPTGHLIPFRLDDFYSGPGFPPSHLIEHQVTAEPVRVWYRVENGVRQAVRIEDAAG